MQVAYSILSGRGNISESVLKTRIKNRPMVKMADRK